VFAVTPSDTADLPSASGSNTPSYAKALWVGGGGSVKLTAAGDKTNVPFVFQNVPNGTLLPVQVRRVWNSGTTASAIGALMD